MVCYAWEGFKKCFTSGAKMNSVIHHMERVESNDKSEVDVLDNLDCEEEIGQQ